MQTKVWYPVNTHSSRTLLIREYFGSTGTRYLGIQEHKDYLSLAHIFGEIVTFWRYTYDGRIQNIGFKIVKEQIYYPALRMHKTDSAVDWNEGFANYNQLPEKAEFIEKDIIHMHPHDQFNNLIARGKEDIEKVLASLTIEDKDTRRRPNQLPLNVIKENPALLKTLKRVASLELTLNISGIQEINIRYSDFKV